MRNHYINFDYIMANRIYSFLLLLLLFTTAAKAQIDSLIPESAPEPPTIEKPAPPKEPVEFFYCEVLPTSKEPIHKFFQENCNYPASARKKNISGKVFIRGTVEV